MSVRYGYFLERPIIEFLIFYERDRYFMYNNLCKFQYRSPFKETMYNTLFLQKKIFSDVTNYKINIKFACFTCKIAPASSIPCHYFTFYHRSPNKRLHVLSSLYIIYWLATSERILIRTNYVHKLTHKNIRT